jgi:hypothetical protein
MNSGNCIFVKAKRGLENGLSKFAFFEGEVIANCVIKLQQKQKTCIKTPVSILLLA